VLRGCVTVAVEYERLDGVDERVGVLELGRRDRPRRGHHGLPRPTGSHSNAAALPLEVPSEGRGGGRRLR
jgi:hypothetical protein